MTDRQVGIYNKAADVSHCSFTKCTDWLKPMAEKTKNRIYKPPSGIAPCVRAQIHSIFWFCPTKWKQKILLKHFMTNILLFPSKNWDQNLHLAQRSEWLQRRGFLKIYVLLETASNLCNLLFPQSIHFDGWACSCPSHLCKWSACPWTVQLSQSYKSRDGTYEIAEILASR